MSRGIQDDRYLKSTYEKIQYTFDRMLPVTLGRSRYFHLGTESTKPAATYRVAACRQLGYRAIMRKASSVYLVHGQAASKWVVFVGRKKS